jgi:ammonium transporter, Amt family
VLNWGTPGGGYFGVTEGDYAFQNAEVNLLWQALGLAVCLGAGLATGWILAAVLKRTTGLRVSEEVEVAGFDAAYWDIVHDLDPAPATIAVVEQASAGTEAGNGAESATADPANPPSTV